MWLEGGKISLSGKYAALFFCIVLNFQSLLIKATFLLQFLGDIKND